MPSRSRQQRRHGAAHWQRLVGNYRFDQQRAGGYRVFVHDGSNSNGIQEDAYVLIASNLTVI